MNTPIGKALGQTMDDMREKKQVRVVPGDAEKKPHIAYENGTFGTATGRFEFYRENPTPRAVTTKALTPEDVETNAWLIGSRRLRRGPRTSYTRNIRWCL